MIPTISASAIYSKLGNNSSLVPLAIKDIANSLGLTTASYMAGDKFEGKDRFIDEFGTQAIWLWGIPAYKFGLNKLLYKPFGFDSEIDVRILKDKNILKEAIKNAPTEEIGQAIEIASKNIGKFKALSMTRFIASTALTALTYLGLTKFRHNYTEKQIKKEFLQKQKTQTFDYGKELPFSGAFSAVHKSKTSKNPTFTGGIQDFMFDPVKNLMLVDGTITTERLTHSRNPQDFLGYLIKEGSFWAFMYGAGPVLSKAFEKYAQTHFNKSIELDSRVIESDILEKSFANGSVKTHIDEFLNSSKTDVDMYKFAVQQKNKNLVIDFAKKSDIIQTLKDSNLVDTRQYINLEELKGVSKKLEKLYNQYLTSGQTSDEFFKQLRKLKRGAVLKNIGSCIGVLGVIAPTIMLLSRKFGKNTDYQVKKDVEAKLQSQQA